MMASELAIALIRRIARDGDEPVHVIDGLGRNREVLSLQRFDGDLLIGTLPSSEQEQKT